MRDNSFFVATYESPEPLKYHEAPYPCYDVWVDSETGFIGMVLQPSKLPLGEIVKECMEINKI